MCVSNRASWFWATLGRRNGYRGIEPMRRWARHKRRYATSRPARADMIFRHQGRCYGTHATATPRRMVWKGLGDFPSWIGVAAWWKERPQSIPMPKWHRLGEQTPWVVSMILKSSCRAKLRIFYYILRATRGNLTILVKVCYDFGVVCIEEIRFSWPLIFLQIERSLCLCL